MNRWVVLSLLIFLIGAAMWDVISRSFPLWWILLFAVIGTAEWFGLQGNSFPELLPAMLPGALLWLAGRRFPQVIGEGDGLLMLVAGVHLGGAAATALLLAGLLCAGVFGLLVSAMRHMTPKSRIPFAPFLLLGFVLVVISV